MAKNTFSKTLKKEFGFLSNEVITICLFYKNAKWWKKLLNCKMQVIFHILRVQERTSK